MDDTGSTEMFYVDGDVKRDRDLHEPILAGRHAAADSVGEAVARGHFLTAEQRLSLFPSINNDRRKAITNRHRAEWLKNRRKTSKRQP
jgi:hypothetical protein